MLGWVIAGIGFYGIWRYVARLPLSRWVRLGVAVGVLLVLFHLLIVARFWGSLASPEIPQQVMWLLSAGFFAILLAAVLLLLRDLLGVLLYPFSREKARWLWCDLRPSHALVALACMLGGIGVWQAVKVPEVRHVEIALPDLPAAFDGYRVVHLTDLHMSRLLDGEWLAKVVARSNALDADVVLISGDLADGTVKARRRDYPALGALHARDGVLAVPGNHEYYAEYAAWMQAFESVGVKMLVNTHVEIRRGDAILVVAGVADKAGAGRGLPEPNIEAALQGRPTGAPVILLDHRPGGARRNQAHGVALQLSGHTHGGHVWGLDQVVALFNDGFVSGWYGLETMQLYVGNGAGLWPGFPIRLGPASEITEITLRRAQREG